MKSNSNLSIRATLGSLNPQSRTAAILKTFLLFLLTLPIAVQAQFHWSSAQGGGAAIDGYTGPGGDVTVEGYLYNDPDIPVTDIWTDAFRNNNILITVTLPATLFRLQDQAFSNCTNLVGVYFQGNAPTEVGANIFSGSTNVVVYYLPGKTGWDTTFAGRPTAVWPPRIDTKRNAWQQRSNVRVPSPRRNHTAVWTGAEMIVWGGVNFPRVNDGGRYSPPANSWTAVTSNDAPSARFDHTAVWTGSEMIIWGGTPGYNVAANDGSRYNPSANAWTGVNSTGAPSPRNSHTAVWTGTEMIVWGGESGYFTDNYVNDGGRYNPGANTWTPLPSSPPIARGSHTAVWTGTEMIVWGGYNGLTNLNDGWRYNLAANTWTAISTSGAPSARSGHTVVWTGTEMIVWGGYGDSGPLNDGGRYNPTANSWTPVSTIGTPAGRGSHSAVWTGTEMIVWGGSVGPGVYVNDGGRYTPSANIWSAVTTLGGPSARAWHSSVWTGSEMIVFGGYATGFTYGLVTDTTFSYFPYSNDFQITNSIYGNNLSISFPTVAGGKYNLWRSDNLASGSWTNTGLPAVNGTGAAGTFYVPLDSAARGFFRVWIGQ